jgi:hypothetical protein
MLKTMDQLLAKLIANLLLPSETRPHSKYGGEVNGAALLRSCAMQSCQFDLKI